MYFQQEAQAPAAAGGPAASLATILLASLVVLAGILPGRLFDVALRSESLLRTQPPSVQATKSSVPQFVNRGAE
jgi:hypothetical protein